MGFWEKMYLTKMELGLGWHLRILQMNVILPFLYMHGCTAPKRLCLYNKVFVIFWLELGSEGELLPEIRLGSLV